jgi:hypothetical protein
LHQNNSNVEIKSHSRQHFIDQPEDPVDQTMRRLGSGVSREDDNRVTRATVWVYYYLGFCDGMSATLESLNTESRKDADWRNKLRKYLPLQLAALRQPNADPEPAVDLIAHEFKVALHRHGDKENAEDV